MALRELGGNFDYGDVCLWPIAANFSLGPHVGFRDEAKWIGGTTQLPRSKMTQSAPAWHAAEIAGSFE